MDGRNNDTLLGRSPAPIDKINGIKFTPREVDILSCLLGGRTAKKIASFLLLSPKTIENYIHNIMVKLECNSRESIVNFLEKSDKVSLLRQHYLILSGQTIIFEFSNLPSPNSEIQKKHTPDRVILFFHRIIKFLIQRRMFFLILFFLSLIALFFSFWREREKDLQMNQSKSSINLKKTLVRSDLVLPNKAVLLNRQALITQIDEKLKGQSEIQTIAFVGMGGSGKTTLARQYAHQQKANVIWEINAETLESLKSSFENLAQRLSKTDEDQKILRGVQEIKNSIEKENKIIQFVKDRLRISQDWFLVFDNVNKFTEVQKYFPQDSTTWGQGKIILTTRDSNIQNNKNVTHAIHIEELTDKEKLKLFTKIVYEKSDDQPPLQDAIKIFLKEIPSFPLDVSVAAYYLKATNLSFESYLNRLKQDRKDFEDVQHNLLKEAGDYQKTRYEIITLSLKQLIKTHPDFQDLLLLISMIDSQNIPRQLLDFCKEKTAVDNFIYSLKKYSLIMNESSNLPPSGLTLSIHRSTQEICLKYIISTLPLDKKNQLLYSITELLENYMSSAIEKEDIAIMKFILPHYKVFLTHEDIIDQNIKDYINIKLGGSYNFLGEEEEAKQILLDIFSKINKKDNTNYLRMAQLLTYLGLTHRSLGDYSEAKNCLEESLKIYERYFPENRFVKALIFTYLGNVYRNLNNYEKSEEYLKKSLFLYKKYFPENLEGKALNLTYLGNLYNEIGNYKRAEIFLTQSLELYKKQVPENQNGLARALGYLGIVQKNCGNYEQAKDFFKMSLSTYEKFLPRKSDNVAWMLAHLGSAYKELGDYEKAHSFLTESQKIFEELYEKNSIRFAWHNIRLGDFERKTGNYEKAKSLYYQSYLDFKKKYGENYISTAEALRCLGQTSLAVGDLETAEGYLRKALEITKKINHSDVYLILETIAELYLKKFENEATIRNEQSSQILKKQARDSLAQALEIVKINFPENSPHRKRLELRLKGLE
jgi:tetratricopeptide (TPR) repeat protein/DNA-binding CsgD family transcriptional regulator/GTPase SAR1 family protein